MLMPLHIKTVNTDKLQVNEKIMFILNISDK